MTRGGATSLAARRFAGALLALSLPRCGDSASQPAAAPAGAKPGAAPSRLLLVTFDTTRADHLGCYGDKEARTPCVDELAARGVLYERAWSAAPITLSSHTTILSGVYPSAHGARENGLFQVAPDARLLQEALHDAGFKTGAFVGSFVLDPKYGLNQGFDAYRAPDASHLGGNWGVIDRPAGAVADDALAFIDGLTPTDRYFLWVHFYDPHSPHEPPREFATDPTRLYDGEISYCDQQLRRILDRLRARTLDAGLVVAVTADHGESIGEHGEKTHGIFVYQATMHVPLVIAPPPAGVAPGTRLRSPVSLADVAATLLERLGIGRDALPDARTPTLPVLDSEESADRALYLESLTPYYAHRMHPIFGVVWKGMKYVETARPELYSLVEDPGETKDLIEERPELKARLVARLDALRLEHPALSWVRDPPIGADDAQNVMALGYGSPTRGGDALSDPSLPDPKDRIGDLDLTDRLTTLVRDAAGLNGLYGGVPKNATNEQIEARRTIAREKLIQAYDLVQQLKAGNPRDPTIPSILSTIHLQLGNYPEAVVVLEQLIMDNPRLPLDHYNLSHAYSETGHPAWAKRELEKSVWLEPRSLFSLRLLVDFAFQEKDFPAMAWWLDELAKCPGQSEGDLAEVKKSRAEVQAMLDRLKATPRPPKPLTEADLQPEGRKAASGSPH